MFLLKKLSVPPPAPCPADSAGGVLCQRPLAYVLGLWQVRPPFLLLCPLAPRLPCDVGTQPLSVCAERGPCLGGGRSCARTPACRVASLALLVGLGWAAGALGFSRPKSSCEVTVDAPLGSIMLCLKISHVVCPLRERRRSKPDFVPLAVHCPVCTRNRNKSKVVVCTPELT